tara:strand:- start:463 stop:603 length:141 start_codon:yes stop_codon:yes gene_type:complete
MIGTLVAIVASYYAGLYTFLWSQLRPGNNIKYTIKPNENLLTYQDL